MDPEPPINLQYDTRVGHPDSVVTDGVGQNGPALAHAIGSAVEALNSGPFIPPRSLAESAAHAVEHTGWSRSAGNPQLPDAISRRDSSYTSLERSRVFVQANRACDRK